jgi:hypothetical protein
MIKEKLKQALRRPESDVHPEAMENLGINNIRRAAKIYNNARYGNLKKHREKIYRERTLFQLPPPALTMNDGWAIDHSRSLPHLDALLEQTQIIIDERAENLDKTGSRGFMRNILADGDYERFPALLDFITSPEMLAIVCEYLKFVPVLSDLVPPGVRLAESKVSLDPNPTPHFRQSQLYHLDFHDLPLVYVIVLLKDVTPQSGPFTFFGKDDSQKIARRTRYGARKNPFRLSDEECYGVVDKSHAHEMMYPRGTVLFIDSSQCFHYGSRNAVDPRYQAMYAYVSPCREDFSEKFLAPKRYPIGESDSLLRKYALNRWYQAPHGKQ